MKRLPGVWTVKRKDELGRYSVESNGPHGARVALDFFDGGGFVAGLGVWRISGIAVAIIEAGIG